MKTLIGLLSLLLLHSGLAVEPNGKTIVLVAGDEEYRSEESMPMLARILEQRHGFKCTVLYSLNPADGTIDPMSTTNLPGLAALERADLCIMAIRFRSLPDAEMLHFVDYLRAGKPLIALRTSTHAFAYEKDSKSPYKRFDWRSSEWPGGFGRQILGETWVSHHGEHGKQSTRAVINPGVKTSPFLKGVRDVWGPTDVYTVTHLGSDATILLYGQVLSGMSPSSAPVTGPKNEPMMPLAWIRSYQFESGPVGKALTTTIGAAVDLESEDLRRFIVNASYCLTGLEKQLPDKADVSTVDPYHPSYFGFGAFKRGVKP